MAPAAASAKEKANMTNLVPWIVAFTAGVVVGSFTTALLPRLKSSRERTTGLGHARKRILAGVKAQHEEDIRREIFQTAEALRGELNKSLSRLIDSTERLLGQVHEASTTKSEEQRLGPRAKDLTASDG
jgi:hypothetical protein